jgi:hypothetical protein
MIFFRDGPAEACPGLFLKRAPLFLRVTKSKTGWDALDQINDSPHADETIFVYQRDGKASNVHIYGQKVRGIFVQAYYRFVEAQPANAVMRSNARWQAWAKEQLEKTNAELDPRNREERS